MKNIFCFLFFFQIIGGAVAEVDLVDLTGDPGHLPYEAQPFSHYDIGVQEDRMFGPPGVLFDVDGDGYQDLIRSNAGYVVAVGHTLGHCVTYYQTNFPPEFCREGKPSFSLAGDLDLDGDGQTEVVVTGRNEDRSLWRFWILDPYSGEIEGSFDLKGGEDFRPDGNWDGTYRVVGMLECSVDGKDRTALIVLVNIGYDIEGRGVLAVDPWTGEILWRFVTGPNPLPRAAKVVDLDLDGNREVVIYGRAPDNLNGRLINGFSDNESRLFVLDNQGELLWTQHLGGSYGSGHLITADLNGDGPVEIITATYTTPEVWGEVVVWSPDGESLARHTVSNQYQDVILVPGTEDRSSLLAVSARSGAIHVLEFDPPELRLVAEVMTDELPFLNCVADILPPTGSELVFSTPDGTTWFLDREFRPLARLEGDPKGGYSLMNTWQLALGLDLLVRESGPGFPLVLAKAPSPPLNKGLIAALTTIALLLLAGFIYWRMIRTIRRTDPIVMREVRLNLLDDLQLSSHGAVAPLKCLRRLIWQLNAMISGLGDNPSIEVRLRETWTECVENAIPHLAGILDRARLAGLAGSNVDFAARSLAKTGLLLEKLEEESFQVSYFKTVAEELNIEATRADDALKDLRQEVSGFFHTDLATTVTRVLRANSLVLEENDVTIQTGFLAQAAAGSDNFSTQSTNSSVTCLIDPVELDFVLDNLVGNAVRAMKDATHKNLAVTWSLADGMVTVDVRDTGCGIPDEHRDRIMETQFSTRQGGGEGLPRSRKILRKYGGGLMILDTAKGHGSTFRVTLPSA